MDWIVLRLCENVIGGVVGEGREGEGRLRWVGAFVIGGVDLFLVFMFWLLGGSVLLLFFCLCAMILFWHEAESNVLR